MRRYILHRGGVSEWTRQARGYPACGGLKHLQLLNKLVLIFELNTIFSLVMKNLRFNFLIKMKNPEHCINLLFEDILRLDSLFVDSLPPEIGLCSASTTSIALF